jgi:hypothetical protein
MTAFASLPHVEQGPGASDVQWMGISKITGPQWARLPILTIGLLGVQVLWSVEMSYGEFQNEMYSSRYERMRIKWSFSLKSISVPSVARSIQILDVPRIPRWATLRIDSPTTHRQVPSLIATSHLHCTTYLHVTHRCADRQLKIPLWPTKTIHDWGIYLLSVCNAIVWVYTSCRKYIHNAGYCCCM